MQDTDNDEVDILIEHNRKLSESGALNLLQDVILEKIEDAKRVSKEIDKFITNLTSLESSDNSDTPFLNQVWSGDVYDAEEVNGMIALKTDLQTQLNDMNIQKIIRLALEKSVEAIAE